MDTKQCDTCKDVVDDYEHGGDKDFGEYKDEVKCIDCIQEYKKDYPYDFEVAEESWKNATSDEKLYFVMVGKIQESVIESPTPPEWKNIKEVDQWVLLEIMGEKNEMTSEDKDYKIMLEEVETRLNKIKQLTAQKDWRASVFAINELFLSVKVLQKMENLK